MLKEPETVATKPLNDTICDGDEIEHVEPPDMTTGKKIDYGAKGSAEADVIAFNDGSELDVGLQGSINGKVPPGSVEGTATSASYYAKKSAASDNSDSDDNVRRHKTKKSNKKRGRGKGSRNNGFHSSAERKNSLERKRSLKASPRKASIKNESFKK